MCSETKKCEYIVNLCTVYMNRKVLANADKKDRSLVQVDQPSIILSSPASTAQTGPKPNLLSNVLSEIPFDGKEHWIDNQETQRRCEKCGKCIKFSCLKCNADIQILVFLYIINGDHLKLTEYLLKILF